MASASRPQYTGAAHTAGIYADLSVDGPIVGTLVAVVDRAKNLPNRKTIGKQDPYCAARLGKEAKKTTTDIRGGQTPKWDQELRFTVHDSPDYYQLKISIFTDDKRTDLIGEAWIDLKSIIIPGGGQADVWQSLSCKGKYAGEIRLEITFYDSRPKPDKPVKAKQPSISDLDSVRQRTSPVKRRPLPSDPVTGEAPPVPVPVGTILPSNSEYYGHQQTPPRHVKQPSHSAIIPNQSPLQAMEYNNTPQGARHLSGEGSGTSPGATAILGYSTTPSRQPHRSRDHYDTPPRQVDGPAYEFQDAPAHYSQSDRHELHMGDRHLPSLDVTQTPPPPPAHRSRHSSVGPESPQVSPTKAGPSTPMRRDVLRSEAHRHTTSTSSARQSYSPHDLPPSPHSPAGHGSPSRHQSYDAGHSTRSLHATVEDAPDSPTGTGTSSYRSRHDSEPTTAPVGRSRHDSEPPTSSMTSSYRSRHDSESPAPLNPSHRGMHDGELSFERDPSPNHYHRRSPRPSPGYLDQAPRYGSSHDDYDAQDYDRGYQGSPSAMPGHGYGGSSHSTPQHRHVRQSSGQPLRAPVYALPAPPASLQHTVDPRLARDVSERINEERQYDSRLIGQHSSPARGRQRSEPPSYGMPSQTYVPPSHHDRHPSSITYSGGPQDVQSVQLRGHGGNMPASPAHSITRKSVSPAPLVHEGQHAADVPFGPDSYDALNPSMISSRSSNSGVSGQDHKDHNGKIVMHDGREVDPSDHLPMESWAPEPEPKLGQNSASVDNLRRSPGGAQPMPLTGRRQMRLTRAETAPMPSHGYDEPHTPPAPTGGRTRLQKKPPRGASVSPGAPSPLAPIHTENHQERQNPYGSHGRQGHAHRGSYDFPSENYAPPQYGSGPPIPAKIPLMSGANGGSELSLAEEMQRIDIGNGRSRRRGGY